MSHAPQPLPGLIVLHRHLCKTGPTLGLDGFPPPSGQCPAILTLQVFTAFLESRVLSRGGFSPRGHQAMSGAISCGPDWCGRAGEHILGGQAAPTTNSDPADNTEAEKHGRRASGHLSSIPGRLDHCRGWGVGASRVLPSESSVYSTGVDHEPTQGIAGPRAQPGRTLGDIPHTALSRDLQVCSWHWPNRGSRRGTPGGQTTLEESPPCGLSSPPSLCSPAAHVSLRLASALPSRPPPVSGIPCAPWEPSADRFSPSLSLSGCAAFVIKYCYIYLRIG